MPEFKGWKDNLIIVLGLLLVFGFTFYNGSNMDVVSHLSLGSTLISIVLSIIAILYTLYQSTAASSQTERLTTATFQIAESADKVNSAAKGLGDVSTQVDRLSEASKVLTHNADQVGKVASEVVDIRHEVSALSNATSTLLMGVDKLSASLQELEEMKSQITASVQQALQEQIAPVREDLSSISKHLEARKGTTGPATGTPLGLVDSLQKASGQGIVLLYSVVRARGAGSNLSFAQIAEKNSTYLDPEYCWGFWIGYACFTEHHGRSKNDPDFTSVCGFMSELEPLVIDEIQRRVALGDAWITNARDAVDLTEWTIDVSEHPKED